jgi:hypothetical protein
MTALSPITENKKVETRKSLIFCEPILGFGLQKPTLPQSRTPCALYNRHEGCHEWVYRYIKDNREGSLDISEWHITKSGHEPTVLQNSQPVLSLLGRRPTIDDQLATSDEGRLIGGEVQHAVGDILRPPYTAQGYPIKPLLS